MLLLEHSPVITIGKTPEAHQHVLVSSEELAARGIDIWRTNRGGDVTYHGPGQLVVYYILAVENHDVHWFVRTLEQSVIDMLALYRIQAVSRPEYPGVWVQENKICALGIYLRKWVTMHGIALNVSPVLEHFQLIVPCGIHGKGVTSMAQLYDERHDGMRVTMEQIRRDYINAFAACFQVEIVHGEPETVWRYLPHTEHSFTTTNQEIV